MTFMQSLFAVLIGSGIILLVLELIRTHMLREKYAMVWFAFPVFIFSTPILFDQYTAIARVFGIIDPISFFFSMAFVLLFLLCLQFSIALTTAWGQRKILMQRIAFLEEDLRALREEMTSERKPIEDTPSSPTHHT